MAILGECHMDYYGRLLILKKNIPQQVIVLIYINNSNNFVCGITAYFKPSIFDRIDFIQKYLDKQNSTYALVFSTFNLLIFYIVTSTIKKKGEIK